MRKYLLLILKKGLQKMRKKPCCLIQITGTRTISSYILYWSLIPISNTENFLKLIIIIMNFDDETEGLSARYFRSHQFGYLRTV